jgi:hypothetical protein
VLSLAVTMTLATGLAACSDAGGDSGFYVTPTRFRSPKPSSGQGATKPGASVVTDGPAAGGPDTGPSTTIDHPTDPTATSPDATNVPPGTTPSGTSPTGAPPAVMTTGGTGSIDVSVATAPAAELASKNQVQVTVTPKNGFTGPVTLGTTGLPAGIAGTFDRASVQVGAAPVTANLSVNVPSNAKAGDLSFAVTANAGGVMAQVAASMTIKSVITLHIPADAEANQGSQDNPRTDSFGAFPVVLARESLPVTLNIVNDDSTGHIIHGPGNFHGDIGNPIQPGQADRPRTIRSAQTIDFYLHDQGEGGNDGEITVQ